MKWLSLFRIHHFGAIVQDIGPLLNIKGPTQLAYGWRITVAHCSVVGKQTQAEPPALPTTSSCCCRILLRNRTTVTMGLKDADLDVAISDVVASKDDYSHDQNVQKLEAVDMDMGEPH